jgi:hypothetical protein
VAGDVVRRLQERVRICDAVLAQLASNGKSHDELEQATHDVRDDALARLAALGVEPDDDQT